MSNGMLDAANRVHDPRAKMSSPRPSSPFLRITNNPQERTEATSGRRSLPSSENYAQVHSLSSLSNNHLSSLESAKKRAGSRPKAHGSSSTFAPSFIQMQNSQEDEKAVNGIDGENDFSGRRYVWVRDAQDTFVRGYIVEELDNGRISVQCDDGSSRVVGLDSVDKVNPAKFDRADDMAELTHLNEASVVHNLHTRYQTDLIYTYSGLFLVTVNPYKSLSIYTAEYMKMYRGRVREDTKPHIYAMADEAFRNLVEEGKNQSILVTGESGAGKTENTKKVIQYLAAAATSQLPRLDHEENGSANLSQQILQANPILEAFGNAQTVRNNNSSRFGKFIRIGFTPSGQIAGAVIDWYLLEKSRVVRLNSNERNYHIFYQMLRGADPSTRARLLLADLGVDDFVYTKEGNDEICGVSDLKEWMQLLEALKVMGISDEEKYCILQTVAAVLFLGNIAVVQESARVDQASLSAGSRLQAERACNLLGIPVNEFLKGLLHPKVRAGREWVEKVQTPAQVRSSLDALSKGIYERSFGNLVSKINRQLNRDIMDSDDSQFIGVLDIAGFEIFESNSFEQLCINYTNEKLQQFFNHHMFVLEQEEYAREQIEWQFIDFGRDLQPTIDLIELTSPVGVFSCLDEDSVMPKATDKTFTEKLHSLWERKTPKYQASRLTQGFTLTHYAAAVEYSTSGWLEKNKDPMNDNVTRLLASSKDAYVGALFVDCTDTEDNTVVNRPCAKKGLFRTVAQRHKEQLSSLMSQLHATHPHFVRCILPNHKKRPKEFITSLVLDQLRCNGVLEGIRIARTGFPNRLSFPDFRHRYELLCEKRIHGRLEAQSAANMILRDLRLDASLYRVGLTKIFFRAGVLAELEDQRDELIRTIVSRFQSVARGFSQRRIANKRLYRAEATRMIQHNFALYSDLCENPWWHLFNRMKPLLGATRTSREIQKRDEVIQELEGKMSREITNLSKLEEERKKADFEIQKIRKTLESERRLALDKEEIFMRLQTREGELAEKLAGAIDDQENLEEQVDVLIAASKKAEEQADSRRIQLEQAGQLVARIEAEKSVVVAHANQLEKRLAEISHAQTEHRELNGSLVLDNEKLDHQLKLQERKVSDLETKLSELDQEMVIISASSNKDLHACRVQIGDLIEQNDIIRRQLQDLSTTSTGYEDMMKRKESEIAVLNANQKLYDGERKACESEKALLIARHKEVQSQSREMQAQIDATNAQKLHLEREIVDIRSILDAKLSEDAQASASRRILEDQMKDLRAQLYHAQAELSRERQSRDDIKMLHEHQMNSLKQDYTLMNESKIVIEKELYVQQDTLRRAIETKSKAEKSRKDLQEDLKHLRERFTKAESLRVDFESVTERKLSQQAQNCQAVLRKELEEKCERLDQVAMERTRYFDEVQSLTNLIADSENFKLNHDQHKNRLERELVTVKGRLAASENDNKALLNKIQQKNLDLARSHSRTNDTQRSRMGQVLSEKAKLKTENEKCSAQINEAQLSIASISKQREKLALDVEDLTLEVERERKAARGAERSLSVLNTQFAETTRNLEMERQSKIQMQVSATKIEKELDITKSEIKESHQQLDLLNKIIDPKPRAHISSWETLRPLLINYKTLAEQLHTSRTERHLADKKRKQAEHHAREIQRRLSHDIPSEQGFVPSSKREVLLEIEPSGQNMLPTRQTYQSLQKPLDLRSHLKEYVTGPQYSSEREMRGNCPVDDEIDLEESHSRRENALQYSGTEKRQSENQKGDRDSERDQWLSNSSSLDRALKLENVNCRLHNQLDDSSRKVSILERKLHDGDMSIKDLEARSQLELYELLTSQETSRRSLTRSLGVTEADLAKTRRQIDQFKATRATMEVELRDARSELLEVRATKEHESAGSRQLVQEHSDLQIRYDAEIARSSDLESTLNVHKRRADEYFGKLEQAEVAVLKATRAEHHARIQVSESEDSYVDVMAQRKQMDSLVEDLQRQTQVHEEKIEDLSGDLDSALQAKKRLQHELEDYRSQRAIDVEDKETTMEQTRRKYKSEFSTLTTELEIERDNVIHARSENTRIRDELENLRSKWDDEVLNSSTWAKEKSRLETTLEDLSTSREDAINAHNESQSQIVSLLSQVRDLRTSMDDTVAERDAVQKEKCRLEARLRESGEHLQRLTQSGNPSIRQAADIDRTLLDLKSQVAQHEDVASAAVGKMRRAEALNAEIQKDVTGVRDQNVTLHKEKAALEKSVKNLQGHVVDLETKGYTVASQDVRFLNGRVQELENQLEMQRVQHVTSLRSVRNVDRTVRDLKAQLLRRDQQSQQLSDDIARGRDKVGRLLSQMDDIQAEEAKSQLQARRAERDLREEREKALRLERELEGWKALRVERNTRGSSYNGGASGSTHGVSRKGSDSQEGVRRMLSNSKGFL